MVIVNLTPSTRLDQYYDYLKCYLKLRCGKIDIKGVHSAIYSQLFDLKRKLSRRCEDFPIFPLSIQ